MLDMLLAVLFFFFSFTAMTAGMAFILSKTVSRMPNKVSRFVFLFVLWVPFGFVYHYVKGLYYSCFKVPQLEYPKISWTEALICALLCATLGTFLLPQPHNSNTQ